MRKIGMIVGAFALAAGSITFSPLRGTVTGDVLMVVGLVLMAICFAAQVRSLMR